MRKTGRPESLASSFDEYSIIAHPTLSIQIGSGDLITGRVPASPAKRAALAGSRYAVVDTDGADGEGGLVLARPLLLERLSEAICTHYRSS